MALGYLDDSKLYAIASAIRSKTSKSATMTVDEMPTEIASINGGGTPNLVIGALRPDAVLVEEDKYDKMAVADLGLTLPSYSTSSSTLRANEERYMKSTLDTDSYDYFFLQINLIYPIYSPSETTYRKGRYIYSFAARLYEFAKWEKGISDGGKTLQYVRPPDAIAYSHNNGFYHSDDTGAISASGGTSYGMVINNPGNPVIVSASNTVKYYRPGFAMRGSTTYYTQTYFNATTDIRYQCLSRLYKAPKSNLNIDGYNMKSLMQHLLDCAESPTRTLT